MWKPPGQMVMGLIQPIFNPAYLMSNQWECTCNFDSQPIGKQYLAYIRMFLWNWYPLNFNLWGRRTCATVPFWATSLKPRVNMIKLGLPRTVDGSTLLTSTGMGVNSANLFSGHITPHCCRRLGNALGSSFFVNEEGAAMICSLIIFQIARLE